MKIFKNSFILVLGVVLVFLGWHFYMKSTWDHNLQGRVITSITPLISQNDEFKEFKNFPEIELTDLVKKYKLSSGFEITIQNGEYYWVSNGNKKLNKHLQKDGIWNFYIYETQDKSEFIKIRYNIFDAGGCDGRQSVWSSGNFEVHQKINDTQTVRFRGHSSFYEHPIQYIFCYDLRGVNIPLLNILNSNIF